MTTWDGSLAVIVGSHAVSSGLRQRGCGACLFSGLRCRGAPQDWAPRWIGVVRVARAIARQTLLYKRRSA